MHQIVSKLDAGDIIDQIIEEVGDIRTCLDLLLAMAAKVSVMLIRFFEGETGFGRMRKQDLSKRSYFGHPTREQVAQFEANGYRMMDSASKKEFYTRVRQLAGE